MSKRAKTELNSLEGSYQEAGHPSGTESQSSQKYFCQVHDEKYVYKQQHTTFTSTFKNQT